MLDAYSWNELIDLTRRLIAQASNSGQEFGVATELKSYMTTNGFDDAFMDELGNVIGVIRGKRPGKRVLFDGHIDTVPVANPSAWVHDPFTGEIVDGKVYGRGTSDMKGAVAAYTVAAASFARECDRDFAGEIYVDGVVHEECFEGVAARSISKRVQPDYVIIGEASQCNIKIGQRGRAEIVLETFGVPAHSANPEKGVNAVYSMCKLVDAIRSLPNATHPVLGEGILELTDIKSSPYPGASVVPSYCRTTYDRRLLIGETNDSVLAPLRELLDSMMREDPLINARVSYAIGEERCYTGALIHGERFFPGWCFTETEDYVQKVLMKLKAIGQNPTITQYSFCTNGSHYAGEAGIPTLGYGPSLENLAHTDDEYIEIAQLERACEGYMAIMAALVGSR